MKGFFKGIFSSEFNRNFVILFSGSSIAQVIPLLASVILARIYTPEEFGVFSVYMALVVVFTSAVNLRYEYAIVLPDEDRDGIVVAVLATITAFFISILLLLCIALFKVPILGFLGAEELGNLIYLVPISVFLGGVYNSLNYFSLRCRKYRIISGSNIVKSTFNSGIQLSLGALGYTKFGLILGNVISLLFGNYRMFKHFLGYKQYFNHISLNTLIIQAKRYRKFPLISVWGILLNNLSINLNNFFISRFFGLNILGQYSYSYRYLNLPLAVISNNMGQIFFQVCAEKHQKGESAEMEFKSTFKKMLFICLPIFVILYLLIEDIFVFAFGQQWQMAGEIARILLPLFFIRTIYGPLSMINGAFERQKLALLIQIGLFTVVLSSFAISIFFNYDIKNFLNLFVVLSSLSYFLALYILFLISKKIL